MNINASSAFTSAVSFVVFVFKSVLDWMDSIILIGNSTSLLDLNIALVVFGIIFTAVFSVVRSGVVNAGDTVASSRAAADRAKKSEETYVKRRDESRKYAEARYMAHRSERGK